jgi:hypothetical protein
MRRDDFLLSGIYLFDVIALVVLVTIIYSMRILTKRKRNKVGKGKGYPYPPGPRRLPLLVKREWG